ncbi:MAG: PHB depolymerase family esterase [Limnobacter sp.]|nr:PHB depolymerase family esterase [Limnobacter sp.]
MTKRKGSTFWTKGMQSKFLSLTSSMLKAGKKVQKIALKSKPRTSLRKPGAQKSVPTQSFNWESCLAASAGGLRRYYLFKPTGRSTSKPIPLVVMLHGCNQDASSFATSTHMNKLASAKGFMVMYPEQDRMSNLQACWNWFETKSGRAQGEARSIMSAVDQVCAKHPIDPKQIVVVGMSAGASMAALLGMQNPDRFVAVAMHSGVGPGMADSVSTAMASMRGVRQSAKPHSALTAVRLPALLVIQGTQDRVVVPSNGILAANRWATALNARPLAPRVVRRGARYPVVVSDWKVGRQVVTTLAQVAGLGHDWSGGAAKQAYSDPAGPDASRMVWAFAQREIVRREGATRGIVKADTTRRVSSRGV